MSCINQLKIKISYIALGFLLCAPAHAQQQADQPRGTRVAGASDSRAEEPSGLGKENLGRAAPSATQIRGVLVKDEGRVMELMRWWPKRATHHIQFGDDCTL